MVQVYVIFSSSLWPLFLNLEGIHRSLGTHVSKVRSLGLDALDEVDLSVLRQIGNVRSNSIWEHSLRVSRCFLEGIPRVVGRGRYRMGPRGKHF